MNQGVWDHKEILVRYRDERSPFGTHLISVDLRMLWIWIWWKTIYKNKSLWYRKPPSFQFKKQSTGV